jgi:hypothetical protein
MTAIVGVLNSRGIAIAADSAVTVTGNNGKKVYNRSNKIFTLSKFHPVGIALYSSADFMGIPLETIIKLYRQKIKDVPFKTLEEYKTDFLTFLKDQLKNVSPELKRDMFYNFYNESYVTIIKNVKDVLTNKETEITGLTPAQVSQIYDTAVTGELAKYLSFVQGFKSVKYVDINVNDFSTVNQTELNEIIAYVQSEVQKTIPAFVFSKHHQQTITEVLYVLINVEFIFETYSGLVFFGFGEEEIYPSTHHVLVGMPINNILRVRPFDQIKIVPGVVNSNIVPYAQGDVTTTVLTGVDPNYKNEVKESTKSSFRTVSEEISKIIGNPAQSTLIDGVMNKISDELIRRLDDYQFNTITRPLLEILAHMGKEDMSELAESLVNITSLKRKFTSHDSADESVGGPVDVAIVTKGDGFIWMKRKHYFDIENNQGFMSTYYKQ